MQAPPRILKVGALLCHDDGLDAIRRQILRMLPAVDRYVVVYHGGDGPELDWLSARADGGQIALVRRRWNDSFADARNAYLAVVEGLARDWDGDGVFVVSPDVDEILSDGLLADLDRVAAWAYAEDYNVLRAFSVSVETDWRGDVVWEHRDGYYKPFMVMWETGLRYEDAFGHFHEDLRIPSGWRSANIDDEDGRYTYGHQKRRGEVWLRGFRNFFAGGGGPNLGTRNPLWLPFRELVRERAGVETSDGLRAYMRAGGIDQAVRDWMVVHRLLGTPGGPAGRLWDEWPDGTSEVREGFLSYFVYLRPEEMPGGLPDVDRHYMDYRREARTIHGPSSPRWAQEE